MEHDNDKYKERTYPSRRYSISTVEADDTNEDPREDPPTHEEIQYIELINKILKEGSTENTRNGKTISIFGHTMRFSLKDGTLPLITTKKTAWKTCLKELLFFIRGQTNNRILKENGVHIWDGNSTREFLDERGLYNYPEDCLGPIYGYQWRNWNAPYNIDSPDEKKTGGIDQLAYIINSLKNPELRSSRRLILTAWNPEQIDQMALPPCHVTAQFNVREGKWLSCCLFQRSGDVGLGVPFNIVSYAFLTHIIAKHCGLIAEEFVYFLGNAHIYEEHIDALKKQVEREPFPFPSIEIINQYDDIDKYEVSDIRFIKEYRCHEGVKMEMKP
jgi:thymidylate synthase